MIPLFLLLCLATAAGIALYALHIHHLESTMKTARHYRKDHPAYLRQDDIPMIDLTRTLPTLQDSLSPVEKKASSFAEDVFAALGLTGLGVGLTYLLFGL
jgi:hypothetical protein